MTGIEQLRKRMIELGAPASSTKSKAVEIILAIFSGDENAPNAVKLLEEVKAEYRAAENDYNVRLNNLRKREAEINSSLLEAHNRERDAGRRLEEIDQMKQEILQLETPEARDRYRLAEHYKQAVRVTCGVRLDDYESQRFISGLSRILAGAPEKEP